VKKFLQNLTLLFFTIVVTVVFCEIILYYFFPQRSTYPRFKFSSEYGNCLYENTTIISKQGNRWEFHYVINSLGFRGKLIEIKKKYDKKNIVVLGDSYTFGAGADEGKLYTQVMDSLLTDYDVINLAVGGWGLTQQIRKFYEMGILYQPDIFILQFCSNDLDDIVANKVTVIEDGKFKFTNSDLSINDVKKYLSYSIIQKSQIYNLFRNTAFRYFAKKTIQKGIDELAKSSANTIDIREEFYNELLEKFANDIHQKGIKFIFISVNDQLKTAENVAQKVKELNNKKIITYLETAGWFDIKDTSYHSPEGHPWGNKAHQVIGKKISDYILNLRSIDSK